MGHSALGTIYHSSIQLLLSMTLSFNFFSFSNIVDSRITNHPLLHSELWLFTHPGDQGTLWLELPWLICISFYLQEYMLLPSRFPFFLQLLINLLYERHSLMRCYTHIVCLGLINFYTFSGVILMTAPGDGERMVSLERDTLGENLSLRDIWGFKLFPTCTTYLIWKIIPSF